LKSNNAIECDFDIEESKRSNNASKIISKKNRRKSVKNYKPKKRDEEDLGEESKSALSISVGGDPAEQSLKSNEIVSSVI
jgi:hypothetical protein